MLARARCAQAVCVSQPRISIYRAGRARLHQPVAVGVTATNRRADLVSGSLEIRVLGPLTLTCGDRTASPSAPKLRSVLALVLLHTNQTVPTAAMIRELWGDRSPASALTTLQTYVLHLRRVLSTALAIPAAQVAESMLITRPGG